MPGFVVGTLLLLSLIESRRPLRQRREPRGRRFARNLTVAGLGFAVIQLLQTPLVVPVSKWAIEKKLGALSFLGASGPVRLIAAVLLLDYTLWIWHWLNHRVRFLWRFHSVHHVDRDMDASTGVRFHFGELGLSVGFRALQIVVLGVDPFSVWVWQLLLFGSVIFHHSNTRLPIRLERVLVRFIVTPRMHGIHHSDFEEETNSNWSSLFSVWDYLHGTTRLDIPQQVVEIGVGGYQDPWRVTLGKILVMPFRRRRDDWLGRHRRPFLSSDGTSGRSSLSE
jgi:sterol desaturase/sphingolipid hydroxylase (fatty acid hydroxylase superfamily)